MNKFPLTTKLGLKVSTRIEHNFDLKEVSEIDSVSAEELEMILQSAQKLYFHETGNGYQYIKTEKSANATHSGLLLMPTKIFVCEKHDPAFHDEVAPCIHCGVTLYRDYRTKE